jgi:hypothetical protein
MMLRFISLGLIACMLAVVGSIGGAFGAALALLLLVPLAAYKRFEHGGKGKPRIWLDWIVGTVLFLLSVLLWSFITYPWVSIGLALFSPLFGLVAASANAVIYDWLS